MPRETAARVDWRELYDTFGERVFRMLHRMTDDAALAEDLTHDVFLRVHHARDQYDGRGAVAAWLFRVAGNVARDELRRRAMRVKRMALYRRDEVTTGDPELRITLQVALDELESGHRAVVLLHDVDGYTHPEIAEMLDIREGTSRARLSRARQALRTSLGDRQQD
jgi:RNA polymerase sigma-70 factor (ECF subfamily)